MSKSFIKTTSHQDNQHKEPELLSSSASYEEMEQLFRKTPIAHIDEKKRTQLILTANKIFNEGDIDKARKIFAHIGYYDGMVRVAQKYYQSGKVLEAYATFLQAGAKKESDKVSDQIAKGIQTLLQQ